VEYTFADGAKLLLEGRCMEGCHPEFASYAHGSRGAAVISIRGHTPARCRIFRGQRFIDQDVVWRFPVREPDPYQLECDHLLAALGRAGSSTAPGGAPGPGPTTAMGRMAAHTGQVVTRDQVLNHPHELAPQVDRLTMDGPAPLQADADGRYPVPRPGVTRDRE